MSKLGRPSKKDQYKDQIHHLYYDEQWSLSRISRELGPAVGTLSRWMTSWGWDLQVRTGNPNEGRTPEQQEEINKKVSAAKMGVKLGVRVPRETRTCKIDECDNTFEVKETSPKQYCSTKCSAVKNIGNRKNNIRDEYDRDPKRCPCGEAIPYEKRHSRQYCSGDHRIQYGKPSAVKNPEKWGIYTCQNDKCGKTFEQRKGYGQNKYCSRPCADKHTKKKQHIVVEDAHVLDSKTEALFWGLCGMFKISVERYDRHNGVTWGEGKYYAPDFKVVYKGREIAVEIKGYSDGEDSTRWGVFRSEVGPLVVLVFADIEKALRDDFRAWLFDKLDNA